MIIEYTITDKMISSVVSASEKIGRIKEIRNEHKHIDFDMLCNVKNVQSVLRDRGISYPDHIIAELMASKLSFNVAPEDSKIVKEEVDKYRRVRDRKSYHPSNFKEGMHKTGQLNSHPQIPKETIIKLTSADKFFLYRIAEFCDTCNSITNQTDLIQSWLATLFLEEYNMLLYFPYKNVLEHESSVIKNGKKLIDRLEHEASSKNSKYPLIEFYMSVIDLTLNECLRIHYKLSNPVSGRIEMLKGKIREPFSRKDYMGYYKISNPAASLDLKKAIDNGVLVKDGDKRNARYWYRG